MPSYACRPHTELCCCSFHWHKLLVVNQKETDQNSSRRCNKGVGTEVSCFFMCIHGLFLPCPSPHRCAVLVLCSWFSEQPACCPFWLLCLKGQVCQRWRGKSLWPRQMGKRSNWQFNFVLLVFFSFRDVIVDAWQPQHWKHVYELNKYCSYSSKSIWVFHVS